MNEEVKKQTQGTFTPVFVGEDTPRKTETLRNLKEQLRKAQEFIPLFTDANMMITRNIVLDCLAITKEEVWTHPADENGKTSIYGTMSYIYKHCPHIDEEFAKQVEFATDCKPKVIASGIKAEIEKTATAFKESVFNVFKELGSNSKERTEELQKYMVVDGGEIKLPKDIEERVTRDTGVWCKTEAQAQAFEAHKQATSAIRDFLKLFPKQYWPHSTAELGNLFKFGENGEIEPQTIDYSLYI